MRPTWRLSKASSSGRWITRQSRDPFVRGRVQRSTDNQSFTPSITSSPVVPYRSRSSFKLLELADRFPALLSRGNSVVDLGAAPGGWSQVALARVGTSRRPGQVVAVDILGMPDLPGAHIVKGDFLSSEVQQSVRDHVTKDKGTTEEGKEKNGEVDTVLSDMMAPMAGVKARDIQASLDLVTAATEFAHAVLKPGGSLVLKFFLHPDLLAFRKSNLDPFFTKVHTDKPKASRSGNR